MQQERFKDLNVVYMTERRYWWDPLHPIYELTGGTPLAQNGSIAKYKDLPWKRISGGYNLANVAEKIENIDALVISGYITQNAHPKELIESLPFPVITYVHSPAHRTGSNTSHRYNICDRGLITSQYRKEDMIRDGVTTPMDVVGWTKAQYFRDLPDLSDENTVLYMSANSGWVKGTFNHSGLELVQKLVAEGFKVMVQPHPMDVKAAAYKPVLDAMKALPGVSVIEDSHVGPERLQELYSKATYYVGDYSGSQLEFGLTGKPIFNLFDTKIDRREGRTRKGSFVYHSMIGYPCETVDDVIEGIKGYDPRRDDPFNREELEKYIPNLGNEAELAADAIYNAIMEWKSKR